MLYGKVILYTQKEHCLGTHNTFKKPFMAINKAKRGLAKAVSGIVCYDTTINIYSMPFKDMTEIV